MRTAGHTILQARKPTDSSGRFIDRTLECSCGRVFATQRCAPEHEGATGRAVYKAGYEAAALHIARVQEAIKTLTAERPCAA